MTSLLRNKDVLDIIPDMSLDLYISAHQNNSSDIYGYSVCRWSNAYALYLF